MPLFLIGMDSGRMLFHQLSKDECLKHSKDQGGQQNIQHGPIRWVCDQANTKNVEARRAPHQTGQEQQGVSFYFHRLPSFIEQRSFSGIKIFHPIASILIKGPADDFQHRAWVIVLAQQSGQHQGKEDACKFFRCKLVVKSVRANLDIPLQDGTQPL